MFQIYKSLLKIGMHLSRLPSYGVYVLWPFSLAIWSPTTQWSYVFYHTGATATA